MGMTQLEESLSGTARFSLIISAETSNNSEALSPTDSKLSGSAHTSISAEGSEPALALTKELPPSQPAG